MAAGNAMGDTRHRNAGLSHVSLRAPLSVDARLMRKAFEISVVSLAPQRWGPRFYRSTNADFYFFSFLPSMFIFMPFMLIHATSKALDDHSFIHFK